MSVWKVDAILCKRYENDSVDGDSFHCERAILYLPVITETP